MLNRKRMLLKSPTFHILTDMLGSGMTIDEILDDNKELEKEDILASLKLAKLYLSGHKIEDVA